MSLKRILLSIACIIAAATVNAQDKILKRNGEVIEAKISLINGDIIVFKRFDNLGGPEYSIPKADVAKVKYANGTEDIFEENNDRIGIAKGMENVRPYNEMSRNKNIIAFAPILFTEHGWGFGFSWEHTIDRSGWVSIYIPATLAFNFADPGVQKDPLLYLAPGIKVYTNLNSPNKNKCSIGPSLIFGLGTGTPNNNNYSIDPLPHQTHVLMGALVNIGANLFPTQHLYLGADFGMGITYLNKYDNVNSTVAFLTQISFRIGYRYESKLKD